MLNKETLFTTSKVKEIHTILTVGKPMYYFQYGYQRDPESSDHYGSLSRVPYWMIDGKQTTLISFYLSGYDTAFAVSRTIYASNPFNIEINGYTFEFPFNGYDTNFARVSGANIIKNVEGSQISLSFNPPPTVISKKVKQVFTSSLKEGVVNAWEGNADASKIGVPSQIDFVLYKRWRPRHKFSSKNSERRNTRRNNITWHGCGLATIQQRIKDRRCFYSRAYGILPIPIRSSQYCTKSIQNYREHRCYDHSVLVSNYEEVLYA